MNNATRKELAELSGQLTALKDRVEDIKGSIENFQSDEQGKFDNLSEGLQQAESGQKLEECANELESAVQCKL